MKMKKLMSGILAVAIFATSFSTEAFADTTETAIEATEEVTEETEGTESTESVEVTEETESVEESTEAATEETEETESVEATEVSLVEETEEATEETESVESTEESLAEETEETEAIETEESLVEETEEVEESLVEETEEAIDETEESTEEVEIIETEETESTEEVVEETEEATEESTEDFIAADFSTEEVSLVSTDAVSSFSEEVTDDTKAIDYKTTFKKLTVGKTYSITVGSNEAYYFYDIPGSTDTDTYYAVVELVSGDDVDVWIGEGVYKDYASWKVANPKKTCYLMTTKEFEYYSDAQEIAKTNKGCTAEICTAYESATLNFTVVRIPSEVPDESKLNVIPDAKGNLTYVWEPTSDCDGMRVYAEGLSPIFDINFDKSTKKYTTTEYSSLLCVEPYVLAGDIPIYAHSCDIVIHNYTKPVTLKTPDTPKVTVDGHYVQITNDDENYKKYGFNGSDLCYEVRDANDKVLYKGDSFEELNSANYGYNRGYNLGKYAGQELKIRVWSTYRTHDAQQNVINLKSGKSDYKVFKVGGPDAPSSSVTTNDSKGIKLGFKTKGADGYVVYRSTSKKDGYEKQATTESTSWTDATAAYGKTYYYKVKAYETINGKKVYSKFSDVVSAKAKSKSLSSPSGVKASSKSYKSIKLSWKSVSSAEGYAVYRSTSKDGSYKKVKTTESTSWTDSGVTTGKTYYYKVKAYKTVNGEKKYGKYSSIVSTKAVLAKPSVTVKSKKAKQATISWKSVKDADGYVVYQSTSKNGSYKAVKTIKSAKTLSYTKTDLKGGKTYYFKVKAYKTVNDKKVYSSFSSIESIKVKK